MSLRIIDCKRKASMPSYRGGGFESHESKATVYTLFSRCFSGWEPRLEFQQKSFFVTPGMVAYFCFFALFFCNTFFPSICGDTLNVFQCACLTMSFFIGLFVVSIFGWAFSDKISTRAGMTVVAIFSAIASSLAVLSFALEVSFAFMLCCFFLAGCGVTGFLILTSGYVGRLSHDALVACVPFCIGVAAFSVAVILHVRPFYLCLLLVVFISVLGAASSFYTYMISLNDRMPFVSAEESKRRNGMSWKSAAAASSQSCCLGYAISLMVIIGASGCIQVVIVSSASVVAAMIVVALDRCGNQTPMLTSERNQLKFFLPCAAIGLFPIAFTDSLLVKIACCCVLLFVFSLQAVTNIYAVSENVRISSLQPVGTYACSRIANYFGYFLGSVTALISFGSELSSNGTSEMLALVMVVVLAFLAALFFTDRFPLNESKPSLGNEEPSTTGDEVLHAINNCEEDQLSIRLAGWKDRCTALAEKIGLSPRQKEVLILLSLGYSAKYIERHLFISYHTVKSHIHNIYQKAGVHSREEIIELVEKMSLNEETPKD